MATDNVAGDLDTTSVYGIDPPDADDYATPARLDERYDPSPYPIERRIS